MTEERRSGSIAVHTWRNGMLETLEALDHRLFVLINSTLRWAPLDAAWVVLSDIGRWGIVLVPALAFVRLGWRKMARRMAVLLVFVAIGAGINTGIKEVVGRPRPQKHFRGEEGQFVVPMNVLEKVGRRSFPSGHSMLAFLCMTYLALAERRHWRWAIMLAALIAVSRVYVAAHFPFDCVVGGLHGAFWGWVAWLTGVRLESGPRRTAGMAGTSPVPGGSSGCCTVA